jgi:hypothetical protein
MLPGEGLHGRARAGGGQLQPQPQRLVAEGRHIEMSAGDARLPRQCQCPNPAAEADAHVADPAPQLPMELQQGGDPHPKVLNASAEDVAVALVDVMKDVPVGVGRNRRTPTTAQATKAGDQVDGIVKGQREIRLPDTAIAVTDEEAAADRALLRFQQPTVDRKPATRHGGMRRDAAQVLDRPSWRSRSVRSRRRQIPAAPAGAPP